MPVEVRELSFKADIRKKGKGKEEDDEEEEDTEKESCDDCSDNSKAEADRNSLIEDCVEKVLAILEAKKER